MLRRLLAEHQDIEVVGDAADGRAALERARALEPAIVVMDVAMPGMGGIEATRQVLAARPGVRVTGLSLQEDRHFVAAMRAANASSDLRKDRLHEALGPALPPVAAGRHLLERRGGGSRLKGRREGVSALLTLAQPGGAGHRPRFGLQSLPWRRPIDLGPVWAVVHAHAPCVLGPGGECTSLVRTSRERRGAFGRVAGGALPHGYRGKMRRGECALVRDHRARLGSGPGRRPGAGPASRRPRARPHGVAPGDKRRPRLRGGVPVPAPRRNRGPGARPGVAGAGYTRSDQRLRRSHHRSLAAPRGPEGAARESGVGRAGPARDDRELLGLGHRDRRGPAEPAPAPAAPPQSEVELHVHVLAQRIHPEDRSRVRDSLVAHLAGRTPIYECEHRLLAEAGTWRWKFQRGRVVERDAAGRPLRMLGVDVDIEQRKQAERIVPKEIRRNATNLLAVDAACTAALLACPAACQPSRYQKADLIVTGVAVRRIPLLVVLAIALSLSLR